MTVKRKIRLRLELEGESSDDVRRGLVVLIEKQVDPPVHLERSTGSGDVGPHTRDETSARAQCGTSKEIECNRCLGGVLHLIGRARHAAAQKRIQNKIGVQRHW